MSITREDWLVALSHAESAPLPPDDPSVVTINEFGAILGKERSAAEKAMKKLLASGLAERTTKVIRMISGHLRTVPAYRLIKPQID